MTQVQFERDEGTGIKIEESNGTRLTKRWSKNARERRTEEKRIAKKRYTIFFPAIHKVFPAVNKKTPATRTQLSTSKRSHNEHRSHSRNERRESVRKKWSARKIRRYGAVKQQQKQQNKRKIDEEKRKTVMRKCTVSLWLDETFETNEWMKRRNDRTTNARIDERILA